MNAPRHLRISIIFLFTLFFIIQIGCNNGSQNINNCCPGDTGELCSTLTERLQDVSANPNFDLQFDINQDGCPVAQDQWILQIDAWCNWPLKSPLDSFISNSMWKEAVNMIRKFPCIILTKKETNEKIKLDSIDPLAILKMCPCDSTLIVLDTTKLNNQELGAVASSKGGPQGNNIFMLPDFGDNFIPDDFEIGGGYTYKEDRGRKIALIDSGIQAAVADEREEQIMEPLNILNPDEFPYDDYGHGTIVFSIADKASRVQKDHSDHPFIIYKAFDDEGVGTMFDVVCALRGARKKADIVNMSWGTSIDNEYLAAEIDSFNTTVIPLIASKGNDCLMSTSQTPQNFPADFDAVYDVAALDLSLGSLAGNSWNSFIDPDPAIIPNTVNYWPCSNYRNDSFQLIAPGKLTDNQGIYRYGTSFAAAYVSGLTARYYFENGIYPDYSSSSIMNYSIPRNATPHDGINRTIWIPTK